MVAAWLGSFFKGIWTVVSTAGTVTAAVSCGPCAPAVAGAFALGGQGLGALLNIGSDDEKAAQERFMREQLAKMMAGIDENGQKIDVVNEMLQGVQAMINTTAAENRQALRDIQLTLKTFEDNMNRNFADLKLFMVEKDFYREVMLPMQMLFSVMETATSSQTQTAVDQFLLEYKANPPRRLLSKFIVGLGIPYSNPIVSAMEHDVLRSRRILDSYVDLLSHLIFKTLALEGFYFGVSDLPKDASITYMEELSKDTDAAIQSFRAFATAYKMPVEKYWPELVKKTLIASNDIADITAKADIVKQQLDGILTSDVFSIFVYSCPNGLDNAPYPLLRKGHETIAEEIANRFMVGHKSSSAFAVVLRSTKFHEVPVRAKSFSRITFHTFASLKPSESHVPFTPNYGVDPFLELLEEHSQSNLINGFVSYGAKPVVRFTNNGTLIVAEADLHSIPNYYGLTWA